MPANAPAGDNDTKRPTYRKLQSAMEYLMTYGWAILIIAVIIGILYSLGVFNISTSGAGVCSASSGYLCVKPILSTTGALNFNFGEIPMKNPALKDGVSKQAQTSR